MARAKAKRSIEEKVTPKKRAPSKIKKPRSAIWSCHINGCNKQFARETDLKRHLNTTKLHMAPNSQPILCPQCDSTFTRTDALKRHQKSRHNGIITSVDSPGSSGSGYNGNKEGEGSSTSPTRGGTTSTRRKDSAPAPTHDSVPVPTTKTQPEAPGPSGAHSYFEQSIINPIFVPPYTPNGVLETSVYNPHQIPMSTARFHAWVPNPQWAQDKQHAYRPPSTPVAYTGPSHTGYYPPGAYYRTPQGQPVIPLHAIPPGMVPVQSNPALSQASGNAPNGNSSISSTNSVVDINANIDPSLRESSMTSEKPEASAEKEPTGEKGTAADTFADSGLSPDVQSALQAVVLAIDANGTTHQLQPSSDKSELVETMSNADNDKASPLSAVFSGQQASKPASANENEPSVVIDKDGMDLDDVDADTDADADGEAVSDVDDESYQNTKSEPSPLPDGIKDLINEDSLSYAAPS